MRICGASSSVRVFTRSRASAHHFGNPFTLLGPCVHHSVCQRTHEVRETAHTLVESSALTRHAGSLKRPRGTCALCSTSCARTRQQWKSCFVSVKLFCARPVRTSRFSIQCMGTRSSSAPWQPNWPNGSGDSRDGQKQPTAAGALAQLAMERKGRRCGDGLVWWVACRGTSLIRNRRPLGPYSSTMPRALWGSQGGGRFLMSEEPLYSVVDIGGGGQFLMNEVPLQDLAKRDLLQRWPRWLLARPRLLITDCIEEDLQFCLVRAITRTMIGPSELTRSLNIGEVHCNSVDLTKASLQCRLL